MMQVVSSPIIFTDIVPLRYKLRWYGLMQVYLHICNMLISAETSHLFSQYYL